MSMVWLVPDTATMDGEIYDVVCAAHLPPGEATLPGFLLVVDMGVARAIPGRYAVTTLVIEGDRRWCTESTYDLTYAQAFDLFATRCALEANRLT